ncbi:hypothetical protein HXX76_004052 [Chlamydomonas incerta]|uniref:Uncharacterized protein n=1 Tax=Chlamydomonas incerta TaxID=51695 RepID=A0A835W778_CHLIN|nr:hypothetical protein HXX76_004052 [Chlamydomonas incerta]|eukprot:KAG2439933.1 hypothetical protein HXX76_004052 [Chlamydomonas incerta]
MRALCSKAVPAPGKVLRLEGAGFVPDADLGGVYIRDCYKRLADVILTTPQKKFILGRLLQRPSPPPFIIWQHAFYSSSRAFCYNTKTGGTLCGEVSSFMAELMNPDTCKLGLPVSKAFVKKCFEYVGGVARYSLLQSGAAPDVAAQDMGPEASHRVIHIMTDESCSVRQLVFASRWVAERFMANAAVEDEQGLVSLLHGSTGTFRGLVHEVWMHRTLPKGGEFTIAPVKLTGDTMKLVREADCTLKLPPCKEAVFEEVVELAGERCAEGVYYKPASARFPLVDSLLRVGGVVNLFQMTVRLNKPVDFAALEGLLGDLGLTPQQETRLIFVVPEDIYPDFKLNVKTGGSRQKKASPTAPALGSAPAAVPALGPAPALVTRPKLCIMRAQRAQAAARRREGTARRREGTARRAAEKEREEREGQEEQEKDEAAN